ncbi:MAG: VOC family protein [Alphaproteobacteria bacterium]|nr:VOC family protein [Alphaproteobacteria bacterium]
MKIASLDHLVLTVASIDVTCAFYSDVMGMRIETFAEGRKSLHFGSQKINLHLAGHEFEPKADTPLPGSADLCFITETPIEEVVKILNARKIDIIAGPAPRTGAIGDLESVYFRDPDDNLIEVSNRLGNQN